MQTIEELIKVSDFNERGHWKGRLWICSNHKPKIVYEEDDLVLNRKNKKDNDLLCPAVSEGFFKKQCKNKLYCGERDYFENIAYEKVE